MESQGAQAKAGRVYLVGAGPGDPRLVTLRGLQCLRLADVILYDGLANAELLNLAPQAEKISVGKHGRSPIWSQSKINDEIIRLAGLGKTVVRLKGGDPAVFARTAEELAALRQHSIRFEVVPGITAALAAASYAGIPLTHRDYASAVALVTGQQQPDSPDELDWAALARFPGTLIVYMGVTTSQQWTAALMAGGKPGGTPAAIVRRCTWSDQLVLRCRLDEVAGHLTPASKLRPPVLVVVGEVASLGEAWNWHAELPLSGTRTWLPRASEQSESWAEAIRDAGGQVFSDPLIRIQAESDTRGLAAAMESILRGQVDGITFASVNGVHYFLNYLLSSSLDLRSLAGVKLASVGPATSAKLAQFGLKFDFQAVEDFSAAGLLSAMPSDLSGQSWLVTTSNHSRDALIQGISSRGGHAIACPTYTSVASNEISDSLNQALQADAIDFVIITSMQVAENVHRLLSHTSKRPLAVTFGGRVTARLGELGWGNCLQADQNTLEGVMQALLALASGDRD